MKFLLNEKLSSSYLQSFNEMKNEPLYLLFDIVYIVVLDTKNNGFL